MVSEKVDSLLDSEKYNTFDRKNFIKPDNFFGPIYAWVWNDKLTKKQIKTQLIEMAENGVRAVFVIPEPKEFRPTSMQTKLEPEYLSKEYWEFYRFAVETAQTLGLAFWFYDEGGWPSGGACGQVIKKRPDLAAIVLDRENILFDEKCTYSQTVAFFAGSERVHSPKNGQAVTRYYYKNSWQASYPSLLEEATVETFIGLTHEGLKQSCGDLLGNQILATFTDEPAVHCWPHPWTRNLLEEFQKKYSYDFSNFVPTLFGENMGEQGNQARIHFHDYWSERFSKTYFERIRTWCKENGILSLGHLNADDYTQGSARSHGHVLRMLRCFDIPGVDVIWEQIYPIERSTYRGEKTPYQKINDSRANHYFPRYASSAAHQQGLRWAFTETGAVYGAGFTYDCNHWVCNYQMVRGINLFSQMLVSYGQESCFIATERPTYMSHIGAFSWKAFNEYLSRSSYICSLGKPCVDVALYLPVRDIWVGGEIGEKASTLHDCVAYELERLQVGFDIIDDDVLSGGVIRGNSLNFGGASYRTLVIANNVYVDKEKVNELAQRGVNVVWVDDFNQVKNLANQVDGLVDTDCKDIRVMKRSLPEGNLYTIFNEGMADIRPKISFKEEQAPVELDARNGYIRCVKGKLERGKFTFSPYMVSGDVIFLFFANVQPTAGARFENGGEELPLSSFFFTPKRQFIINPTICDTCERKEELLPVQLGRWKDRLGEDYSGEAVYVCKFHLDKQQAKQYRFLSCGEVEYSCQVILNGETRTLFAKPFVMDVSGLLKSGENILEIVVANTAANQFVYTKNLEHYKASELGPYHKRTLELEKQTLGGGLIGPVCLIER